MKGLAWFRKEITDQKENAQVNYANLTEGLTKRYNHGALDTFDNVLELLDQVEQPEQPELPVIPDFVADFIERYQHNLSISQAFRVARKEEQLDRWLTWMKHEEMFARAWLDDYTVEEKKRYEVKDKHGKNLLFKIIEGRRRGETASKLTVGESGSHFLTEQEIKDYDERYFAFAVPVEEVIK